MAFRRGQRLHRRYVHAKARRRVNAIRKQKERTRRDGRMMDVIRDGSVPYAPEVLSWLSRKLNKPSSKITADDVVTLGR